MIDVIILHSGEDEALIAPIAAGAKALGLDVRSAPIQERDDSTAEAIEAQIEDAGVLLVCWSERAVTKSAIRTRAAIASATGKLAACRLAPCSIPFPLDAAPMVDLQNWGERIDAAEWRALIAALGEKLRRPGLAELLRARVANDQDALNAFAKTYPDEPEAQRIWSERESKYRDECAAMLRDARQHLEQRVTSERSKIENALTAFSRDFDCWLERERRGETSPKPSLNTLFEIWLERGGRRGAAATDESWKQSAAKSEAKALELQERLDAETSKLRELERKLQAAELQNTSTAEDQRPLIVVASPPPTPAVVARPKRKRRLLTSFAFAAIAVTASVAVIHGSEREPPQMKAAIDWLETTSATIEARGRQALAELAAKRSGEDALGDLLAADKDRTIARAVAHDPQIALARLKDIAPDPSASARPGTVGPDALLAGMSERERGEMVSAIIDAAPSEALAQLLGKHKREAIDRLIRVDRAALTERLAELAPQDAAPAPAAPAIASEPAELSAQQAVAKLTQLAPRELSKALETAVAPQTLSELARLLTAATAPKLASYRTYDNRDIGSEDLAKMRGADLQSCVSACRKRDNCKAYTFDKWNRICYLKSSIGDFKLNPRSSSGVREDVRIPRGPSGEITMERYPSRAFPGSGYKSVKSDGPDTCEQSCRSEDACIAFTFRLDEGSCHLFRSTGEYFPNELADSGGKRQE